jgi:hypothetical protein
MGLLRAQSKQFKESKNKVSNNIEDLAATLSAALESDKGIETAEQAKEMARALAIIQMGVEDELSSRLAQWTLMHGPVTIDELGDQAYGQWEKKSTMVGDESALWALLSENGRDPNNYKRADLTVIKSLLSEEETLEGIEELVGCDTTFVFGFKRNLLKKPRGFAKPIEATAAANANANPRYGLGPQGVTSRARVVKYNPGEAPARPEREVMPSCSVMPPAKALATR